MPRAGEAAFEQITDAAQGELSRRTALVYRIVNVAMLVVKGEAQPGITAACVHQGSQQFACLLEDVHG
jgi:hypothetical protein